MSEIYISDEESKLDSKSNLIIENTNQTTQIGNTK